MTQMQRQSATSVPQTYSASYTVDDLAASITPPTINDEEPSVSNINETHTTQNLV
jgi:hypothetical protein